jgi:hypothetical protein
MAEVKQSKVDLENHLREQISFLQASASSYDSGFMGEAKRLAVIIRVLLHDTHKSTSLMSLLGIKGMNFIDSAYDYDSKNLVSFTGLVLIRKFPGDAEYTPRCKLPPKPTGEPERLIAFDDWWNKVVVVDRGGNKFRRCDLVLTLSNKAGGAHIDLKLDASYVALTKCNSVGWRYWDGEEQGDIAPVDLASVRQIAHEVLLSLKQAYPQYFNP